MRAETQSIEAALWTFVHDARQSNADLSSVLGVDALDLRGLRAAGRERPRGASRLEDGRRIAWRFHGAGVYVRVSGRLPVDYDFGELPSMLVGDLDKVVWTKHGEKPGDDEIRRLRAIGVVGEYSKFVFTL
jgi:hypothetical protein